MNKKLLLGLGVAVSIFVSSSLWAQSVEVVLNWQSLLDTPMASGQGLEVGTTVLLMIAGDTTPAATHIAQPYFIGGADTLVSLTSASSGQGYSNPTIYWGYAMELGGAVGDFTGLSGDYNFFARVISNTVTNIPWNDTGKADSFDANGNFLQNAQGTMDLSNVYYFDTDVFTINIPDGLSSPLTVKIDIPEIDPTVIADWSPDGAAPNTWTNVTAVPEPGAMMLMASGMLFLVRKIKK